MRWTERQQAMLREMGVHLWLRDAVAGGVDPVPAEAVVAAEARATRQPLLQRVKPVPASAPRLLPADWLVVGEALDPGDPQQEQLLDNMLRAIGVARKAPARERRATYVALAGAAAADSAALAEAIAAVAPRCIVALGRAAAAALLGDDAPIGNWRGRCHSCGALPVVVTFSLAFLLRHPADKAKAWADLCLAVGVVTAPIA